MKNITYLSLFFILVFSISCRDDRYIGTWISTHQISNFHAVDTLKNNFDIVSDTFERIQMMNFRNDTMLALSFNLDSYDGFRGSLYTFKLQQDSIYLKSEEETIAFRSEFTDYNTFEITTRNPFIKNPDSKTRTIFKPLTLYRQSFKKSKVSDFLTSNLIYDPIEAEALEFSPPSWRHMGKVLTDGFKGRNTIYDDWYLIDVDSELLLNYGGNLYHVFKYSKDGLELIDLITNIKTSIQSLDNITKKFDSSLLIGKWTNKITIPEADQSFIPKSMTDLHINHIEFLEEDMIMTTQIFQDTIKWNSNIKHDKILLSKQIIWKILKLTDKQLKIERLIDSSTCCDVEELIFDKN